jgi:hypothetical protein
MKKKKIFKRSSKIDQNPSRYYYNSIITNLKFQHKPKYHLSKKSSYETRPITLGQNPLSYYIYSMMNVNTISLPAKARPKKYSY